MNYTYKSGEEIQKGDLITVDYGYEHCIILKLLTDKQELEEWDWVKTPGPGVFAYSYRLETIDYVVMDILVSDETQFLGRCPLSIFIDPTREWRGETNNET